jgi:transposase-like protein
MPKGKPITERQKEQIRKCVAERLESWKVIELTGLDKRTVSRWVKKMRGEG